MVWYGMVERRGSDERVDVFSVALSTQVGMVHYRNISVTDVLNTNIRIIIANIRIIIGPSQAHRNARQAPKN